jgi:uncharacterized protein (TIGR02246 family)
MGSQGEEIVSLYQQLLDAWNDRDASAYARLFSENGSIVGFDGSTANGRSEIEAHLKPIFTDHPTARYVSKVRYVRDLGPGAAVLRAVAGMIPPGEDRLKPERNTIQTLLASRREAGDWQIEMFQNTPARFDGRPDETERLTRELEGELQHS